MSDLTPDQVKWVARLSSDATAYAEADATFESKQEMIDAAWKELDAHIGEIRIGQSFSVQMRADGLPGFLRAVFKADTKQAIVSGNDQDKALDTGHDARKSKGLTPEDATALMKAQAIVVEQVEMLRTKRNAATRKPLFNDGEIAKEIWEPLMRRKVVAENAITDRYSDVSTTFEGASEQYDLRLTAYTESVSKKDGLAARLGLASDVVKGMDKVAESTMKALVAAGVPVKLPIGEITEICTAATLLTTAPLDIAAVALKQRGLNTTSIQAIAKTVVGAAAASVTLGFQIKFPGDSDHDKIGREIGKAINAGLQAGLSSFTFAAKIAEGKPDEAMMELGTIVSQCCACAGSAKAVKAGELNNGDLARIGSEMGHALNGSSQIMVMAAAAKSDDPIGVIAKALPRILNEAVQAGASEYAIVRQAHREDERADKLAKANEEDGSEDAVAEHKADYDKEAKFDTDFETPEDLLRIGEVGEKLDPEHLDVGMLLRIGQTKTPEQLAKLFEEDESLKANKEAQAIILEASKRRKEDFERAGLAAEDEVAKDAAAFRRLLSGSEAQPSDQEVESIETLILQIKKDQMIIKLAEGIASMGTACVAAFLPPAAIATDAAAMAIAMRKAASHLIAWREWNDNVVDARSAMSVQASAMANRAGISRGKAIDESINALGSAVKIIGDSFATVGGPFAPAGVGVTQGVNALMAAKEIILKLYTEAELKRNWNKYVDARRNSEDRTLIRAAIRGNPTLSKYVIAYGGVIAEDPVAKNALRKCGLNTKVLQSPSTNEQKVVSYLEALYADDPVLLHRLDDAPKWYPGPIAFSAASVSAFSGAATGAAKPPLSAPINPAIAKGLIAIASAEKTVEDTRAAWDAVLKGCPVDMEGPLTQEQDAANTAFIQALNVLLTRCGAVVGAVTSWQPQDTSGKPHTTAVAYRDTLLRMAVARHKKAEAELSMYADSEETG